jgi:hypothetical protein
VVDRTLTPAAVNGVSLAVAQLSGTVAGAILTAIFLGKSVFVKTNLAYFIFSLSNIGNLNAQRTEVMFYNSYLRVDWLII